jgi:uncharacterized protein (TIGR02453 family)
MAFSPELFTFLTELRDNNDRDWFARNKERYETHVLEPALDFIEAFGPRLEAISPHFVADPRRTGGSMFRIHRDTRFSKDKTPYKTAVGMLFRHEQGRETAAPGFYLHLQPGDCFAGGGIWHPDTATANRIREAIATNQDDWREATGDAGLALGGESLKRAPRGFDPDHPLIEDIKRKNFGAANKIADRDATAPTFVDDYASLCRRTAPLMRFICDALGLKF